MKRTKKRKDDTVERLEKQVRALKAENRTLHRRLKKIDRDYKVTIEEIEKEHHWEDEAVVKHAPKKCKVCERGELIETTLGKTKFYRCSISECGNKGRYEK